ncbi:hypothetical protein FA13DRAFT_1815865 [Coprinellus micaceus]|uniref:Uncharacterized protein n=1 Tax=Coprinellus micaceus TaxID=71717 RepID=A0A4Y7T2X0_COPMI|nr:hypothetical protein FA13DRAFT_1815865 [Coprinellus micaceus]
MVPRESSSLQVWANHPNAVPHIAGAVTASARWNTDTKCVVERDVFEETYPRNHNFPSVEYGLIHGYGVASVKCPITSDYLYPPGDPEWFPNFDLTVNFTGLFGSVKPGSGYNLHLDAVRVYIGLTDDTAEIVHNTEPILLFPGTNILSVVRPVFRERFKRQGLATLGFESLVLSLVTVIEQTIPNPFMDPPEDKNISTLSLTRHSFPRKYYFIQDYRTKSVVDGLSSIGGLGSLLSTLLVMLLGTSLITALFREKPQSLFGLLHSIGPSQTIMADACDQKYPALRSDLQKEKEDAGVLSLLLDTLIDIDSLGDQKDKPTELEGGGGDSSVQGEQAPDEEGLLTATDTESPSGQETAQQGV